ncbi:MAG TPA: hypothetical protein VGI16_07545 [Candidatus Acidoferrum sp.]|jgi:hypothetical protein
MLRPLQIVRRILGGLVLAAALVYAGDFLLLHLRMSWPRTGPAFGTVTMDRLYAIAQNGGKIDYEFDVQRPQENVSCVRSIFPHSGYRPCWYLERNQHTPIPMTLWLVGRDI